MNIPELETSLENREQLIASINQQIRETIEGFGVPMWIGEPEKLIPTFGQSVSTGDYQMDIFNQEEISFSIDDIVNAHARYEEDWPEVWDVAINGCEQLLAKLKERKG